MLNSIPLPAGLDESRVVAEVEALLNVERQISEAGALLFSAIRASSSEQVLRRQFDNWFALSTSGFVS